MHINGKKSELNLKITNMVFGAIRAIEIFLAGLLVVLVTVSAIYFIGSLIRKHIQLGTYSDFQQLLSYLLLLIIALELAYMLIEHKSNNVIEVMIYAIARKMLIYNTTALELLLSVITLGILFVVKMYLIQDKPRFLKSIYSLGKKETKKEPKT